MRKSLRKHIKQATLEDLAKLSLRGVPITRLIKDHELDVSPPHLTKLIRAYLAAEKLNASRKTRANANIINASLFPPWLDNSSSNMVQVQPGSWRYDGYFPFGMWLKREAR